MPTKTTRDTRATNRKTRRKRCVSSMVSSKSKSGRMSLLETFLRLNVTNLYQPTSSFYVQAIRRAAAILRPKIWMVRQILSLKMLKKMSITTSKMRKILKRLTEKSFVKNPTIRFISLRDRLVSLITMKRLLWVLTTFFYVGAAWGILILFTASVFSQGMIPNLCRIVQMPKWSFRP